LRLGAAIAVRAGERLSECTALALLDPVPDGASYLATLLRHRQVRRMITAGRAEARRGLEADEIVDLDGYAVRRGTLAEIQTLGITGGHLGFRGRVLVVQLSFTDRLRPETAAVRDTFEGVGAAVDVRALVMPPFWSRIDIVDTTPLEEAVAGWFGTLAQGRA